MVSSWIAEAASSRGGRKASTNREKDASIMLANRCQNRVGIRSHSENPKHVTRQWYSAKGKTMNIVGLEVTVGVLLLYSIILPADDDRALVDSVGPRN